MLPFDMPTAKTFGEEREKSRLQTGLSVMYVRSGHSGFLRVKHRMRPFNDVESLGDENPTARMS